MAWRDLRFGIAMEVVCLTSGTYIRLQLRTSCARMKKNCINILFFFFLGGGSELLLSIQPNAHLFLSYRLIGVVSTMVYPKERILPGFFFKGSVFCKCL